MKRLLLALVLLLAPIACAVAAPGDPSVGYVTVASASAEASHVIKASGGYLFSAYFTNTTGATNGFLVALNATSAPVDGAITPSECIFVASGQTAGINFFQTGEVYPTGITLVFTTANTCFTKTTGVVTGFFHAAFQ